MTNFLCPPSRYDFVEVFYKSVLIASQLTRWAPIAGLSIDEGQAREEIITKILRNLIFDRRKRTHYLVAYYQIPPIWCGGGENAWFLAH